MRDLLFIFLLALGLSAASQASDLLPPEKWPRTIEQAVVDILRDMPEDDKQRLRDTSSSDLIMFHMGWGMGIRNQFGLWRGNHDLMLSACGRPCHPDDASMLVIEAVWRAVQR